MLPIKASFIYFPGTPVLTSQVYHAGPFSDTFNGCAFIAQVGPLLELDVLALFVFRGCQQVS
jgi:hypothetical protein